MMFHEQLRSAIKKGIFGQQAKVYPGSGQKWQRIEKSFSAEEQRRSQEVPLDQREYVQRELLLQRGFSPEEIEVLCWFRYWYQHGGSDRALILYHLEFLRRLVAGGHMER